MFWTSGSGEKAREMFFILDIFIVPSNIKVEEHLNSVLSCAIGFRLILGTGRLGIVKVL